VKPELLIWAGGLFHLAFVVFHLLFRKLFRWDTELAKLTSLNRAVVPVLNISLVYQTIKRSPAANRTPIARSPTR